MTYTDIVEIVAPASARAGDTVRVVVRVKNIYTGAIYISVTGRVDETSLIFTPSYAVVNPGEVYSFAASFIMPNKTVRVHSWSWYWDGSQWQVVDKGDDYEHKDISLAVLEPVFSEFKIKDYIAL